MLILGTLAALASPILVMAQQGPVTPIDVPGSNGTHANGINNAGQIVGWYSSGTHSFLRTGSSVTTIDVPGSRFTQAYGINDSGQIVGSYAEINEQFFQSFLLTEGGVTNIHVPGAIFDEARGINNAGQIVGWYTDARVDITYGFLRIGSSITKIEFPGAIATEANGINDSGQIVGDYTDSSNVFHGFLLTGSRITPIDVPGARSTVARGINNAGQIVGSYTDSSNVSHAFLLTGSRVTTIALPITSNTAFATEINDAAPLQIVGYYDDSSGEHSFVTTFPNDAGFNVNSDLDFVPLTATYSSVGDTTACPATSVGKFSFKALLTNKSSGSGMTGISVHVVTLSNGNVLLDPQTNAVLGAEGGVMRVPEVGQYADGLLSPGESVEVPFVLCVRTFEPFQFFVDVFTIVTEK
jgi:probable HAF family extracellular repeat protein